jgi:hypothetical protein
MNIRSEAAKALLEKGAATNAKDKVRKTTKRAREGPSPADDRSRRGANFSVGDFCQAIVKIIANISGINTTIGQYEARSYNAVSGSFIFQLTCTTPPIFLNALDYVCINIDTLRNVQSIVMDSNSWFFGKLICRDA